VLRAAELLSEDYFLQPQAICYHLCLLLMIAALRYCVTSLLVGMALIDFQAWH
jgi:hypothetical protein